MKFIFKQKFDHIFDRWNLNVGPNPRRRNLGEERVSKRINKIAAGLPPGEIFGVDKKITQNNMANDEAYFLHIIGCTAFFVKNSFFSTASPKCHP